MNDYARLRTLIGSDAAGPAVRRWTRDFMTAVLDGSAEVIAVRHPLGFLCFPAWRGDGFGVCVHVWTEGLRAYPTTSPMHAHSWDLLSVVLYGKVGNKILEVDSTPERPTHRVFEIHSAADGDVVRATAQLVAYRVRSSEHFRAGEVYTLPHGAFHVSDVQGEAATVALGEVRHGRPDRSLGTLATTDHRVHRTGCTPAETRRVAQTVLARLREHTLPEQLEDRCEQAT
ncbi:hypothetical protein OG874_19530 [Nocardia sp. NBC_00565]|uniref:hypothetical protein n=1 Tax=Nocardia sp. NBC_00565 TaxID=2975993 RepID=UPI002E81B89F|nr:hypothetical protein [Nocardia sp. NBC_00565]WUC07149.1 hypothetical protein OG874_19530 [Nocardia sp. NBC_00565]